MVTDRSTPGRHAGEYTTHKYGQRPLPITSISTSQPFHFGHFHWPLPVLVHKAIATARMLCPGWSAIIGSCLLIETKRDELQDSLQCNVTLDQIQLLTIFRSASIYFSVRAIADTVHWPVMTFVDFLFLPGVEVIYSHPWIRRRSDDEPIAFDRVKRGRRDRMW